MSGVEQDGRDHDPTHFCRIRPVAESPGVIRIPQARIAAPAKAWPDRDIATKGP